jgi:hypothetical protein
MKNISLTVFALLVLLVGPAYSQPSKAWTDWSKKEADKMLNSSAWAQTVVKGEERADTSIGLNQGRNPSTKDQSGNMVSSEIRYRIRFVTARPIREAFARKVLLSTPEPAKDLQDQMQAFVDKDYGDVIVVAVNVDGENSHMVSGILQGLAKLTAASLNGKVFLERRDGTRQSLVEYRAPSGDNIGGKFIFARSIDGKPFLSPESDSVRFILNISENLKLEAKFKVSNMVYGEKLEY